MTVGVIALSAAGWLSGCGTSAPSKAQGGPTPCGPQPVVYAPGATAVLISAARLSAVVQVSGPRSATPRCVGLSPGATVSLHIGDSTEFVANEVPQLDPAGTGTVSIASRPGPTSAGMGGLHTTHLIIRLTAGAPGSVTVRWIDCSGTAC